MAGKQAYGMFNAMRLHFKDKNFNYHRYNNVGSAGFDKKSDAVKNMYEKLSAFSTAEDLCVVAFYDKPVVRYIGDMFTPVFRSYYEGWLKRRNKYNFIQELEKIPSITKAIKSADGSMPPLLNLYFADRLPLEIISIVDRAIDLEGYWNNVLKGNILWEEQVRPKIHKYRGFLEKYYNVAALVAEVNKKIRNELSN